ncbi:MAG: peptidoglycan DD-metalloendopeptidase family protein [Desulfobacterium sp.]
MFLMLLTLYCGQQHKQLNQMVSINTSLRNTIYTQHGTLCEQEQKIMEQMLKSQDQEDALMEKILALGEMTHRFQSMSDEIRAMHHQTTQLASLGEQVRTLANIEELAPSQNNMGIGGNTQNLSPIVSLSLDRPRDSDGDMDIIQKRMNTTQKLLNQQTQKFKTLKDTLETKNEILACTPSIKPTSGVVTCKFGPRLSPFSGKREFHTGIDIANKRGTKVYASARGKVIFAKKKWLIGNLVTIDHGNNIITKYGHLNKFLVKKGDVVNRGDIIGLMGSTGNSTGPHVHYEVVVNGKSKNPANYFSSKLATLKKQ